MRRFSHRAPAVLWIWLALPLLEAQGIVNPGAAQGQPLAALRYDPASQPLPRDQLSRIVPLKPNQPVTPEGVRATIKDLYATGRYSYVEVDSEPAAHGVSLTIRTRPQWFVGRVEVEGKANDPPNAAQLENATRLQLGQPFTADDLKGAVEGVEDLLHRNGFFEASVVPDITRDEEHQQLRFRFLVNPGRRARLTLPTITGNPRIPSDELAKAARYKGWFRWKLATAEEVQNGVHRIDKRYKKEDRLVARVELQDETYNAATNLATPIIHVNGGPKVDITAVGAKISKGKLKSYVPVFEEQAVDRDLLVEGAANLRDYFQIEGYFDAEVDFQIRRPDPDHAEVVYVVIPGERHKLVDVTIRGNHYFTREAIRERMFLQPAGFLRLRHGRYSRAFARRDARSITALYQANGFRDVKVTTDTISDFKGKRGDVAAVVTIDEGPQYAVSTLTVNGVNVPQVKPILSTLANMDGQPFSEANVALDRDTIIRAYQSDGYPDAAFAWRMEPGPGAHQMRVEYTITEGPKRYVRGVLLTGLRITRPSVVDPNIRLEPGEPLSWTRMADIQRRLYNLGIFERVNMAIQNEEGDTESKYVLYDFKEGHRYYISTGLGAEIARIGGSQTDLSNPAGATGFSPRVSFNVSRMNLWGIGHSATLQTRYSSLDKRAALSYLAPRFRGVEGRNAQVSVLYDNTRDVRTFTARSLEGIAQVSQQLSKASIVFARFSYRDSKLDQSTLKINPLLVPLAAQTALVGMLSGSFIYDRRDDPVNAHRGVYNTLDFGVAPRVFGSRVQFTRFLGRSSIYKSVTRNDVLASNLQFGWISPFGVPAGTVAPEQTIPLPERFFAGGSMSSRAFPQNQAGPRDPVTGFPIGGNALLFHTLEFRFPFIGENIDGVLFHDMGNVYTSLSKISFSVSQPSLVDFNYMVHAVGFGIRYRTPVGPIRVDLAYSINPPTFFGFKGTFEQLIFNQGTRVLQNISHFQFFISIGQAF